MSTARFFQALSAAVPKYGCISERSTLSCLWKHLPVRRLSTVEEKDIRYTSKGLPDRGLVRVAGADSANFLQGLITNDMRCLEGGLPCQVFEREVVCRAKSLYAMMLNVKGRVMFDLIVYSRKPDASNDIYLIETEKDLVPDFMKTLKMYKIRKKVDISEVSDEYRIWSVFDPLRSMHEHDQYLQQPQTNGEPPGPAPKVPDLVIQKPESLVVSAPDPRVKTFGHRVVTIGDANVTDVIANCTAATDDSYNRRRYEWGIAEGSVDYPTGECFPLECNAAFTHAVSFTKGCYIGQELTARTHHTGVVRKRLLPVHLPSEDTEVQPGCSVENNKGKKCGKMRGSAGPNGLALLRLGDVIGKGALIAKNTDNKVITDNITADIPLWWPKDTDEIVMQLLKETG